MKALPNVPIELDKPRHLRISFLAFAKFKETTGKSLYEALNQLDTDMELLATAIWAGLLHEDPDLQLDTVQDLCGPANLDYIQPIFMEAFSGAMPKQKKSEQGMSAKNAVSRPSGTG